MDFIKVSSSNIEGMRYDSESHSLIVIFKGKELRGYRYFDVPSHIFEGMVLAESKGKFFASEIKGKFKFEPIQKQEFNPTITSLPVQEEKISV